ncbi:hypothetical protein D3C71_1373110 [compost metagenome]
MHIQRTHFIGDIQCIGKIKVPDGGDLSDRIFRKERLRQGVQDETLELPALEYMLGLSNGRLQTVGNLLRDTVGRESGFDRSTLFFGNILPTCLMIARVSGQRFDSRHH